ncbi:MAG: zinc ribbon domain-containing protein [Candidatus Omnitrophica bacterium]|nr:zinc ribbon domain-containing protein [Candidatus Omnitrophota bacterium]
MQYFTLANLTFIHYICLLIFLKSTIKKQTQKYRYYVCTNAQKRGYHSCPNRSLNAQAIEEASVEYLKRILSDTKKFKERSQEAEALLSPIWDTLYPEEKRRILRVLVKKIYYSSEAKKLGINLNGSDIKLEFDVDLKKVRTLSKWHKETEIEKEPKIRRSLILAYQIQRLIDEDKIPSIKQAAEWLNVIPVRLDQTLNMLLLSPAIQEEIIFSPNKRIAEIPEYKIRSIISEPDWQKQGQLWRALLS